jgi:hypothetical protein
MPRAGSRKPAISPAFFVVAATDAIIGVSSSY